MEYVLGYDSEARGSFLKSFISNGDVLDPLVSSTLLIPSISESLEQSVGVLNFFRNNLDNLLTLFNSGGFGVLYGTRIGNIFETEGAALNENWIRQIPVSFGGFIEPNH